MAFSVYLSYIVFERTDLFTFELDISITVKKQSIYVNVFIFFLCFSQMLPIIKFAQYVLHLEILTFTTFISDYMLQPIRPHPSGKVRSSRPHVEFGSLVTKALTQ